MNAKSNARTVVVGQNTTSSSHPQHPQHRPTPHARPRRGRAGRLAALAAGVVLGAPLVGAPATAAAQEGFDLQQFNPMPDQHRNYFSASSASVAPHLSWQASMMFNYAHAPLVLRDANGDRLEAIVPSQTSLNVLGSIGLADRFELGFDVPLVANTVAASGGGAPLLGLSDADASLGVGDLRLVPKYQILDTRSHEGGPGSALAIVGDAFIPVGSNDSLQGGDLRGALRLAVDIVMPGGLQVGANVGYLIRPNAQLMNVEVGNAMTWALAGELPVTDSIRVTGELFGKATLGASELSREEFPTELLVGSKYHRGGLFAQAGGGLGIVSGYGTPDFRLFAGIGYALGQAAPEPMPEPFAEPTPEPTPAVAAVEPAPPKPEPVKPEPVVAEPVVETAKIDQERRQIVIGNRVHFETDSDRLLPSSNAVLDEVAAIMRNNPTIVVRIEGHTDSRGSAAHNRDLSRRRAEVVQRYLEGRGIERRRMNAVGRGPDSPLSTNTTDAGRALNRRVEFHILDQ